MAKARDAFRTISEVSDWLDTPAHVLRFWESKFSQIKPVKRAGGRRYYRPEDMQLLGGIKTLLHEQGMTIKGAQKLLREKGVKHVAALSSHRLEADEDAPPPPPKAKAAPEVKSASPAPAPVPEPPAPVVAADPAGDAAIPAPVTAMPPPTQPPATTEAGTEDEDIDLFADLDAPDDGDDAGEADAAALPTRDAEPILPREAPAPAEPRIFAALRDAPPNRLHSKAAQIAPLLARLEEVRDRMRQA